MNVNHQEEHYLHRVKPGKKGASVSPMKNRQMQNPTPLLSVRHIIVPHAVKIRLYLPGHGRHADRTGTPHNHGDREEPARVRPGHDHVAWELADEIANVESRDTGIPYGIGHA
jgi:hypothetical protein